MTDRKGNHCEGCRQHRRTTDL